MVINDLINRLKLIRQRGEIINMLAGEFMPMADAAIQRRQLVDLLDETDRIRESLIEMIEEVDGLEDG